jgi:hypothetical protein
MERKAVHLLDGVEINGVDGLFRVLGCNRIGVVLTGAGGYNILTPLLGIRPS